MNKQPEALRLADALTMQPDCNCYASSYFECACDAIWPEQWIDHAAAELRRLHGLDFALRDCELALNKMAKKYMDASDQRDALLEALKEIAADYADRFDLDCPSTNPGIKSTIKQARAAIKAAEENT